MSILPSALESQRSERDSDSQPTEWLPLAEGFRRFEIGKLELYEDKQWGGMKVKIPLTLTPDEQKRLIEEVGEPKTGMLQSYRSWYRPKLKLGYYEGDTYKPTMLIDFLCAALGTENGKKFRKWIEKGGHAPRPEDKDDRDAELQLIEEWLNWWQGLEVYGTITQKPGNDGRIWANFAGPMPIGSLPGQPEPDYQALCRGKVRAIVQEGEIPPAPETPAAPKANAFASKTAAEPAARKSLRYEDVFDDDDDEPAPVKKSKELPF